MYSIVTAYRVRRGRVEGTSAGREVRRPGPVLWTACLYRRWARPTKWTGTRRVPDEPNRLRVRRWFVASPSTTARFASRPRSSRRRTAEHTANTRTHLSPIVTVISRPYAYGKITPERSPNTHEDVTETRPEQKLRHMTSESYRASVPIYILLKNNNGVSFCLR